MIEQDLWVNLPKQSCDFCLSKAMFTDSDSTREGIWTFIYAGWNFQDPAPVLLLVQHD